jgi:prevent-host-death family protein
MSEIAITDARGYLAAVVNRARTEPVFLTRHGKKVVAMVDAAVFEKLLDAWEEVQDIRALDEAEKSGEVSIPWEQAKRVLAL